MKKLVYVPDIFEADHVLELLSTEGIHAVKTPAASESIYGGKNQALSGYYIFVSEEAESRAKDILESVYQTKEAAKSLGRKRKVVKFVIIVWSLLAFAVLLMGLFIF